jgi:cytochrome c oxidase subunit III
MSAETGAHAEPHRDYVGAKLGMWIFIFTELILFGGLFVAYGMYRSMHAHDFHKAAGELNVPLGVTNTVVLLTSSLTMVLSIVATRLQRKRQSMIFLASTVVLGCTFLVNKFFEWRAKIGHGLYPGSEHLMARPPGERLFFGLYYGMTGLHGLHVTVGVVLLSVMFALLRRDRIRHDDFGKLENAGLYWHLVDVIWIFLLPLFYLAA